MRDNIATVSGLFPEGVPLVPILSHSFTEIPYECVFVEYLLEALSRMRTISQFVIKFSSGRILSSMLQLVHTK